MSDNKNEMSEEEYLKRHLQDMDQGQKTQEPTLNTDIPFNFSSSIS